MVFADLGDEKMKVWLAVVVTLVMLSGVASADRFSDALLAPGTLEVGGISDLCLIYHGRQVRVDWTADAFMPYVAYVDEEGEAREWLFDGFLFLEFAAESGAYLHAHTGDRPAATPEDWEWLTECWFREGSGLAGLDEAVARVGGELGEPERKVQVVICLPLPAVELTDFGRLPGDGGSLNFSLEPDRRRAMDWYMARVLEQWDAAEYGRLELAGFYWMAESIPSKDAEIVRWTADRVHALGYKLYWIPFFGATGLSNWREFGIDATMLQPNHFFSDQGDPHRLLAAAKKATMAGCGIEIEFDGRALNSDDLYGRFYSYLDAAVQYGWMNGALLGYYEGGRAVGDFARSPGRGREMYDALRRFVRGTYETSGPVDISGLKLIVRDNTGDLALESKGAKVHGALRPEEHPTLAPEHIIDGDIYMYGGMSGFGYCAIPGAITVELGETARISRTQMMLFDTDSRVFRYRIDTSVDGERWDEAVDKSEGEWRGWQVDSFEAREAKFVRVTPLYNSVNPLFQLVELEVYAE